MGQITPSTVNISEEMATLLCVVDTFLSDKMTQSPVKYWLQETDFSLPSNRAEASNKAGSAVKLL